MAKFLYGVKNEAGELIECYKTKAEAKALLKEMTDNHNKAELVKFESENAPNAQLTQ